MRPPAALVTGATGFVGSRLVRCLVGRGERVKALVREGSSLRWLRGLPRTQVELAFGDIQIEGTVYRALAGCDRLYHVASAFKMWDPRPERILGPAVEGTRTVLRAAQLRGIERIVVTSSVAALGNEPAPTPMDEGHAFTLAAPELYALSKRRALDVTLEHVARGLPIVIVQPSAIAGPGDWKPTPIGRALVRILSARWPLPTIAGGFSLADVDDVVAGHIAAMERGRVGEAYVLGGENLTTEGLVRTMSELFHVPPPGRPVSRALLLVGGAACELGARLWGGEPPLTYRMAKEQVGRFAWVTSAKAERELGYRHRPATETLRRSVRWFARHGYLDEALGRRLRVELGAPEETPEVHQ